MSIAHDTAAPPIVSLSRAKLLLMMLLAFAVSLLVIFPSSTALVVSQLLIDGPLLLAWLGACWGVGYRVTRSFGLAGGRMFQSSSVILEFTAQTAFGIGILALMFLVLGCAGFLNQIVAVALLAIGNWVTLKFIYQRQGEIKAWLTSSQPSVAVEPVVQMEPQTSQTKTHEVVRYEKRSERRALRSERALSEELKVSAVSAWPLLLVMPVFAMMVVAALTLPGIFWGDEPHPYDVLAYHLQLPREWFEAGRITATSHNVFGYFPLNVEMHYLFAMTLRNSAAGGMYLAQLMHASMMALTLAAVYGAVRRKNADGSMFRASVAVVLCAAIPWMMMLGSVAYNECGLMLFTTLAVVAATDGRWIRAGLLAGLAAGCKITAVPALIGVLLVLMFIRRPKTWWISIPFVCVAFLIPAVITLSPWLLRDSITSPNNPVFPIAARSIGPGYFDAGMVERFEVAHAARPDQQSLSGRVTALNEQVFRDFKYGSIAVGTVGVPLLLVLIVPALGLNARNRATWMFFVFIVGNTLIWLFATHLQGRFLVPIIPIAAILIASVQQRWWSSLVLLAAIVIGPISFRTVFDRLHTGPARSGIAFPDPSGVLPEALTKLLMSSNRPVYLVGDARAFLYPVPTSRLHYRSVFDVPSEKPFKEAWLGTSPASDAIVIVLPSELERFEKTYRNLPKMPDEWRGRPMFVTDVEFKKMAPVE